jgi:CubicO group peptidase (beta-lactamase class C family)
VKIISILLRIHAVLLVIGVAVIFANSIASAQDVAKPQADSARSRLATILHEVRDEFNLPALGAAVVVDGKLLDYDAVGVRKRGEAVPVTRDDQFHLGSCTKAMTATLLARLIESQQIRESLTIAEAFPEWKETMLEEYRDVTFPMLLSHRAGFPPSGRSWPDGMSHLDVRNLPGEPPQQRLEYVRRMLLQKPVVEPGTSFSYSNAGYTVVAVMLEQALDTSWEKLMQQEVFEPLQMTTAGFGAMGTPGQIDQPWQHRALPVVSKITSTPIEPGPSADNPVSIHPGGGVHCSVRHWSQFVIAHLTGKSPAGTQYLTEKSLEFLHTPVSDGEYAAGWMILKRGWGDGTVLHHNGTNTMNFAIAWVAPKRKFAVLVVTNQAGSDEAKACDRVASSVIRNFLADKK